MAENPHNSAIKSPWELWREGVSLDKAVTIFGRTQGLSKIRREARTKAHAMAETGKKNFRRAGKNFDDTIDALGSAFASMSEETGVRSAMEERLFERLRSGELIALGFQVYEPTAKNPVEVPVFMFNRDFAKWKLGFLEGFKRHYADVRVILSRANDAVPALVTAAPTPTKKGRGGRRSQWPKIKLVLDELFQTEAHRGESAGRLIHLFNELFNRRYGDGKHTVGISARNLQDHLKRYWQELEEIGKN